MEDFIKLPNLPKRKISLGVVDGRTPGDIIDNLIKRNIRIIKTKKINCLYEGIAFHPDILIHHLGSDELIVAPNCSDEFIYELEAEKFKIIQGNQELKGTYPYDIPYNVAVFGDKAVCNVNYTDKILLDSLSAKKLDIIDVKQGYSKCSICIVDENAVITSDKGICQELKKHGVDVLMINSGNIQLSGMNYGFIGGATGSLSDCEMGFYGNVTLHPNFKEIVEFLFKYNKKLINLSINPLMDLGTLIPLKEYSILVP